MCNKVQKIFKKWLKNTNEKYSLTYIKSNEFVYKSGCSKWKTETSKLLKYSLFIYCFYRPNKIKIYHIGAHCWFNLVASISMGTIPVNRTSSLFL